MLHRIAPRGVLERTSVLVAQLGARRHYAVARALQRQRRLERLVTDIYAGSPFARALEAVLPQSRRPKGLEALLARRAAGVPASKVVSLPLLACSPLLQRRVHERQTDYWARRNGAFCRAVVRRGFGEADVVYAYNGAALEIFEAAKARGLATVLDQTALPWRRNKALMLDETARWPGWEDRPNEIDMSGRLTEREEEEWTLADRIVCGSRLVAESLALAGVRRDRLAIVCHPAFRAADKRVRAGKRDARELRVLFVGTLELRKGVPYLVEAARLIRGYPIHIRLVGPSCLSRSAMQDLAALCEAVGPVARSQVGEHYGWADAFVLPTLSEGSANACREALSAGLPVITTPAAGAAVEHERNGLLVGERDPAAIAAALVRLLEDSDLRTRLSGGSELAADENDALDIYGRGLVACFAPEHRAGSCSS